MPHKWTTSCLNATFSCTAASLNVALTSFHVDAENADAIFLTKGDAPITETTTKAATDKTDTDKSTALALVEQTPPIPSYSGNALVAKIPSNQAPIATKENNNMVTSAVVA